MQEALVSSPLPETADRSFRDSVGPSATVFREVPAVEQRTGAVLLKRIRATILMAGSVQPSKLAAAAGRSMLNLPFGEGRTLLDSWRIHAMVLARRADRERIPVRIVVNRSSPAPVLGADDIDAGMTVETDPTELRGTGGVLRDICSNYEADDYVLVATAARFLVEPLADLVMELLLAESDVALVANADGTPSSVMLIRRRCLDQIPKIGFVDLKEQALPMIAREHSVKVVHRDHPVGLSVRTLEEYIAALRLNFRRSRGDDEAAGPFAETWQSAGSIVEDGAIVDPTAKLHDSVVLAGARVGANAVLVRSLVCAGATVARGRKIVDQIVTSD